MAYCSGCGQPLQEGTKFCSACGTASATSAVAVSTVPVTRVIVVEPKKAGRLAFKGFLTSFLLAAIFAAATKGDKSAQATGMLLAFGIGTAYIIYHLRKWKQNNDIVEGTGVGWTTAVLLAVIAAGGLLNISSNGGSSSIGGPGPATTIDPKDVLIRDVKLDCRWQKGGFDTVMIADFTITNPTQYRFKDFEVKCTHYAPSGTEIDSNTRTIYEIVEPHSTKFVNQMNMGFIHSQAAESACKLADLAVVQ
jgi:hypothetical protein